MSAKLKVAWNHLLDSWFHYVMHFVWGAVVALIFLIAGWFKESPPLIVGSAIALALLLLIIVSVHLRHWLDVRKREHRLSWRRRRELRRYTDAGLDWRVLPESHTLLPDGRMAATLAIAPVPGNELPQPLDIIVTCAGRIAEVSSTFHFDSTQADKVHISGDVEIDSSREKTAAVRLLSPKLLPPSRWDLTLISAGNAEIKVIDVRRAPRKGRAG